MQQNEELYLLLVIIRLDHGHMQQLLIVSTTLTLEGSEVHNALTLAYLVQPALQSMLAGDMGQLGRLIKDRTLSGR